MRNDLTNAVGRRVVYQKFGNSSRNGWTGTIANVYPRDDRFEVAWDDDGGEVTSYSASAFTGRLIDEMPDPLTDFPVPDYRHGGYIHLLGDAPAGTTYIIAGENGGQPQRMRGTRDQAEEVARRRASKSKSGQAYLVFRAVTRFQRTEPPVQRTVIEQEEG